MNKKDFNLLFPLITAVVAVSGFLVSLKVLMPKVAVDQAKVSAAESDLAMAGAKLDSINSAEVSMTKLSEVVNNLLIAVPDSVNAPDLITEIAAIASANQVAINTLSPPSDNNSQTGSTGSTAGKSSNKTADSGSSSLGVVVSVQGSFPNINNFISGIETSIRFSKITSLTISGSQEGSVTASISFDVYKRPAIISSIGGTK